MLSSEDWLFRVGVLDKIALRLSGEIFMKSQWDGYHQDDFIRAINELHDKGLIEWGEQYVLVLTGTGHKALSLWGGNYGYSIRY